MPGLAPWNFSLHFHAACCREDCLSVSVTYLQLRSLWKHLTFPQNKISPTPSQRKRRGKYVSTFVLELRWAFPCSPRSLKYTRLCGSSLPCSQYSDIIYIFNIIFSVHLRWRCKIWGFDAVTIQNSFFWVMAPCRSCMNRRFGERIASIFRVEKSANEEPAWADGSLADFSTLKMEAIRSFETSIHTRTLRRHIPEDGILHPGWTSYRFG
jgi:hypothetical protein